MGSGPRQKINTQSGLSFGPSTALHPPAHIHKYALADAPCLILYKTGEPKYGAILRIYFLSRPLNKKRRPFPSMGNWTPLSLIGLKLSHAIVEKIHWSFMQKEYN